MRKLLIMAAGLVAGTVIVQSVLAMHHGKSVFTAASDVQYDDIIPGVVAFSTVTGDREKSAHGTFVRIPPGQETPAHKHSAEYSDVIIQGIMENPIVGDAKSESTLGAGRYYHIPANATHITRCTADSPVDCISYFYQDVAFDFTVVE